MKWVSIAVSGLFMFGISLIAADAHRWVEAVLCQFGGWIVVWQLIKECK